MNFLEKYNIKQGVVDNSIGLLLPGLLTFALNFIAQFLSVNSKNLYITIGAFFLLFLITSVIFYTIYRFIKNSNFEKIYSILFFKRTIKINPLLIGIVVTYSLCSWSYASNFFNFYYFYNQLVKSQISYDYNINLNKKNKWLIINALEDERINDKTISFSRQLNIEFNREINTFKLPIDTIVNALDYTSKQLDSLINTNDGVYEISGFFDEESANIELHFFNNSKNPLVSESLTQVDTLLKNILDESSYLRKFIDSLKQVKINKNHTKGFSQSSNTEFMKLYDLKVGIPDQIKYFIYSTTGEILTNQIRVNKKIDSLSIDTQNIYLNNIISILKLAEEHIPKQFNFWGFSPKPQKNININRLYWNLASVLNKKAQFKTSQFKTDDVFQSKEKLQEGLLVIEEAMHYLDKIPNYLDLSSDSTLEESLIENAVLYENKVLLTGLYIIEMNANWSQINNTLSQYLSLSQRNTPKNSYEILIQSPKLNKLQLQTWAIYLKKSNQEINYLIHENKKIIKKMNRNINKINKSKYKEKYWAEILNIKKINQANLENIDKFKKLHSLNKIVLNRFDEIASRIKY